MQKKVLYEKGDYKWIVFGRDSDKSEHVIDTNEYMITTSEGAILMDPGGTEVFPPVVAAISKEVHIGKVHTFICSHQDPDIMSSLPLWMGLCPKAKIYMSWIWTGFIAHFGHEYVPNFVAVPDEGISLPIGKNLEPIQLVPAHYCHSSGNFSVFDPNSRILFSGDIGGALLPKGQHSLMVENFEAHIPYMELFHQRWMPSNAAKNAWIQRVRALKPTHICPQHGSVFTGDQVGKFLDWFEKLEVGSVATISTPIKK